MELTIIVMLTMILTPVVFCPLLLADGYILPQIGIMSIGMSIAFLMFLKQGIFPCNLSAILAVLFFVYSMVSGAWSTVPHNSLRDVPLVFGYIFAFIITSVIFTISDNSVLAISISVVSVSMFCSLYGLLQRYKIDPLFPERLKPGYNSNTGESQVDDRAIATLGNSNFAAGFYCSTVPFSIYLSIAVSPWFLICLGIILVGIWATSSRAAALSVICGLLFFILAISTKGLLFDTLFLLFGNLRVEYIILLSTLILVLGSTVYLHARENNPLWFLSVDNRLNNYLDISGTHQDHFVATLRYRFRYWATALELFLRRPLQGYGLRTYRKEVYDSQARLTAKDPEFMGYDYQTPQPRECHNDWVENFVEGGIVSGLLFLFIVGTIFYNGYSYIQSGGNFLLTIGIMSGLVCIIVNSCFFFPLRLGSSSLPFWVSLALLEGVTKSTKLIFISINWLVIFFVAAALLAMLWEGVIKPNLGNYYFAKFNISKTKKGYYIDKALHYCPKESIFLTHLLIGHLWVNPNQSDQYAEQLRRHFDGMVPAWSMAYNCGLAKALTKNYEDAVRFFMDSIKYYPSFEPAKEQYKRYFPFAPFPRGGYVVMKVISEQAQNQISFCEAEINNSRQRMANLELSVANIIQNEKINMNIPPTWPYDMNSKQFIPPESVGNREVVMMGPTKLPVIKPNN